MRVQGLQAGIWSLAVAAASLLAAGDAREGIIAPTRVHSFSASLKAAFQDENDQDLDRIGRESGKSPRTASGGRSRAWRRPRS